MNFVETEQRVINVTPDQLPACYSLLQQAFCTEELNSLVDMQADLSNPVSSVSKEQFVILARVNGQDDQNISGSQVISLIAGCYLVLSHPKYPNVGVGFIEYLVTDPIYRHLGHASSMLSAFELEMMQIANSRREKLSIILGEVEPDFVDFKQKRGYHQLKGSIYAQPPISYDVITGIPLSPKLPKILMIKSLIGEIETDLLLDAVRVIFTKRYVPKKADERSALKVMDYINKNVYAPFSASLQGDRGIVILA
jgi:hypothetical protein